ncbi:MAG: YdeI/OmpD-associated family protein [Ramlibacter sp.]|nr:YdeI/OmpD-associated family protein [Ramlibacter sp.]
MSPTPIPESLHEFKTPQTFERWLATHHASQTEVWIKLHKVGSGLPSITPKEAIDVALCWGWIDAVRRAFDDKSYLQRYTPRGKRSIWSKINVANVARLEAEGRMKAPGLAQVELARADGRWDRAYGGSKEMEIPADLVAALKGHRKALQTLAGLSAQNRFAIAFRLHNMKTEAGRARRLAAFVQMLKDGETIYPQKPKA